MSTFTLPWRRYGLIASAVVIVVFGGLFWFGFGGRAFETAGEPLDQIEHGRDLRAFQGAGELAASRDGEAVYDHSNPVYTSVSAAKFVNPPWFAMLMMPIAQAPFSVAFPVWSLLGVLAMWWSLGRAAASRRELVVGVSLLSIAGALALYYGQNTLFMVAALLLASMSLGSGRGIGGAAGIALLAFKPHLFLGFGVWWSLEVRTRWRWIATAGAVTAALSIVSAWWLPGAWPAFFEAVADPDSLVHPVRETTLISAVRLLGASGWALWLAVVCVVAAVLTVLFVGLRRWAGNVEVGAALAIVASLLVAPHGLVYDWLLLIPAGVLLARNRVLPARTVGEIGVVLAAVVAVGDTLSVWQDSHLGWALHIAPLVLGAAFVWVVTSPSARVADRGVVASHP